MRAFSNVHVRRSKPFDRLAKHWMPRVVAGFASVSFLATGSASAQAALDVPPSYQTADQFGVDVVSGNVTVSSPTISIGDPKRGGLAFTATWDSEGRGWRYSSEIRVDKEVIFKDIYCLAKYTVVYLGKSNLFQRDGCGATTFSAIDSYGALTQPSGQSYIYRYTDGSTMAGGQVTRLNGEVISYTYSGGLLTSVSNNFGYQLHFEYSGTTLAKVTALNNAVDACALTAATCSYSRDWPSLTFTTVGLERRVTDNLGRTTRILLDNADLGLAKVINVSRPSRSSGASITYTYAFARGYGTRVASASDGLQTWTYTYGSYCAPAPAPCPPPSSSYDVSNTVTAPDGGQTVYRIFYSGRLNPDNNPDYPYELTPALYSIKNALNQVTLVSEDGSGLHGVGHPEGNSTHYMRNRLGQVYRIRNIPKAGSGLNETNVYATYPDCATEPVRCYFPSSTTDARGNVTDYTYDAAGNLLTQTGPAAVAGGPRPQTRYVWEQRYAWYKQNGSSAITRAATPVWVQVSQSQCMTGATC